MSEALTTVDGRPLKAALASAERSKRTRAVLLVLPLFVFIFFSFLYPIALMLYRSVENPLIAQHMPYTLEALEQWNGKDVPDEDTFAALAKDLKIAAESREIGKVATRLNFETPGLRSVITGSGRKAKRWEPPFKEQFLDYRKEWSEIETWATIKRLGPTITGVNYLAALDRQRRNHACRRGLSHLRRFVHAYDVDEYHGHGCMLGAGLPDIILAGEFAAQAFELIDDFGAVAVLDVAAGADHIVDRAVADARCAQRYHGLEWHYRGCPADSVDFQRARDRHCDDADIPTVYGAAALQRHENDLAELSSRRRKFGCAQVLGVLAGLRAEHTAGHWCRVLVGVHFGHWLLHYAGACRWPGWPDDIQYDRVPYAEIVELGLGRSARWYSVVGRYYPILAVQ